MEIIKEGIRDIFLDICIFIYRKIFEFYEIFERLCKSRILDTDTLNSIARRIGLLLGIIMLFIVSFSIIQMILEPEKLTDKEKGIGNITKKIILVIVMLGTSSFIFNTLYSVQRKIIDSHIISKIILPYTADTENFGGVLSANLFTTFFKANISSYEGDIKRLKEEIIAKNSYSIAKDLVNQSKHDVCILFICLYDFGGFVIYFDWVWCPIFGLAALYFLFSYCISVGTRSIQLAFLEIISPMAIVSYLSPKKDTMFEKWWKLYFSTYIDVFIRIMIINLVVFLISVLFDESMSTTFWNSVGGDRSEDWIKVFMVLALLTFGKKAPDLLKDLFPAGASKLGLGMSSPKNLFNDMAFSWIPKAATGVVGGALGGAAIGILSGSPGGIFGGLLKGGLSGLKGQGFSKTASSAWKSNKESIKKMRDIRANGGDWLGYKVAKVQKGLSIRTAGENDKQRVDKINDYIKYKDEIEGYAKNSKTVKTLERTYEAIKQAGRLRGESDDHYTARIEAARQNWKRAMEATVSSSMTGRDIDYHEATIQRNITTGKWEVVDVAATSSIIHSSIEPGISSSISSKQEELNRVGNSLGYGATNNYATMDAINNQAKADAAHITSTKEYSRNKANNS